MKNTTVAITLSATNSEVLDEVTGKIARSLKLKELDDLFITVLPATEGVLKRKITVVNPTDKNITVLSKIVVPNTVNIAIVNN